MSIGAAQPGEARRALAGIVGRSEAGAVASAARLWKAAVALAQAGEQRRQVEQPRADQVDDITFALHPALQPKHRRGEHDPPLFLV